MFLLESDKSDAFEIFGSPDFMKLKSSMTLFAIATDEEENVFNKMLYKFLTAHTIGEQLKSWKIILKNIKLLSGKINLL